MSVSPDLIAPFDLGPFLGLSDPKFSEIQPLLAQLVTAASLEIEDYTSKTFIQRSFTEDYPWDEVTGKVITTAWPANIVIGGAYQRRIQLRHHPIVPKEQLDAYGNKQYYVDTIIDQEGNEIPPGEYIVHENRGVLEGNFMPPFGSGRVSFWRITYTAGLYASREEVDDERLKLACAVTVADWYKNKRSGQTIASKTVGDLVISYDRSKENSDGQLWSIPPMAAALLTRHVRVTV